MAHLGQGQAPVSPQVWQELSRQAKRVVGGNLFGRTVVDVEGPRGADFAAVSRGRLSMTGGQGAGEVHYGLFDVAPLVETRVSFSLSRTELDNIDRGARDVNIKALEQAGAKIAHFEDDAIFEGFAPAAIAGLGKSSAHRPLHYPADALALPAVVAEALGVFQQSAIQGPFALVLPTERWAALASATPGYPLMLRVAKLVGGPVIAVPRVQQSYLISQRGGDFTLSLGQDLSLGFSHANGDSLEFFFTESFTFRVVEPAAVLLLA
jgi:uncharacterized linocin/CFP29 family protein